MRCGGYRGRTQDGLCEWRLLRNNEISAQLVLPGSPLGPLDAMRLALAAALAFFCGVAGLATHGDAANAAPSYAFDVCGSQSIPRTMVGSKVVVRGRVHSDVEGSWIYGDACPETVVRLRYRTSGPFLISCLTGSGDSRCGGLSRNEQLAIVEGILTEKRHGPKSPQGLPVNTATIEVTRFWAPTDRLPFCKLDIRPLKMGTAVSPVGEAAWHKPGRVLITFLITRDGSVSNVRVIDSSDDWYNSSALDLVSGFRFSPRPSPCHGQYTVRFTLQ